jgi:hypothetical protein
MILTLLKEDQMPENKAFIGFRAPKWMRDGVREVAKKHRVDVDSIVLRWAIEDYLKREGITEPDTTAA